MLKGFTEDPNENIAEKRRLPKLSDDEEEKLEIKPNINIKNEIKSSSQENSSVSEEYNSEKKIPIEQHKAIYFGNSVLDN